MLRDPIHGAIRRALPSREQSDWIAGLNPVTRDVADCALGPRICAALRPRKGGAFGTDKHCHLILRKAGGLSRRMGPARLRPLHILRDGPCGPPQDEDVGEDRTRRSASSGRAITTDVIPDLIRDPFPRCHSGSSPEQRAIGMDCRVKPTAVRFGICCRTYVIEKEAVFRSALSWDKDCFPDLSSRFGAQAARPGSSTPCGLRLEEAGETRGYWFPVFRCASAGMTSRHTQARPEGPISS